LHGLLADSFIGSGTYHITAGDVIAIGIMIHGDKFSSEGGVRDAGVNTKSDHGRVEKAQVAGK
jgi:hypothetical protein